jgi:hypothetical protein
VELAHWRVQWQRIARDRGKYKRGSRVAVEDKEESQIPLIVIPLALSEENNPVIIEYKKVPSIELVT